MPSPPTGRRSGSWFAYQAAAWPISSLAPEVSRPTQHRTVSEAWYIVQGLGRMWRRQDGTEREIDLRPGTALTIPVGTAFQFRNTGFEPLAAVGVTMPPWPGEDEAMDVAGPWAPQLTA